MLTDKKPYWQAAQFYREYDLNLNKALENVNKATDSQSKSILDVFIQGKNPGRSWEISKQHQQFENIIRIYQRKQKMKTI
jgi:hypothetical protein